MTLRSVFSSLTPCQKSLAAGAATITLFAVQAHMLTMGDKVSLTGAALTSVLGLLTVAEARECLRARRRQSPGLNQG